MLGGDVLHEVELVMVMRIDATIVTLPRRSRLESMRSPDLQGTERWEPLAAANRVEVDYEYIVA
jgi:hypothetical protein